MPLQCEKCGKDTDKSYSNNGIWCEDCIYAKYGRTKNSTQHVRKVKENLPNEADSKADVKRRSAAAEANAKTEAEREARKAEALKKSKDGREALGVWKQTINDKAG